MGTPRRIARIATAALAGVAWTAAAAVAQPVPSHTPPHDRDALDDIDIEETGDYDTASVKWNGLSSFDELGRGLGLRVEHVSRIHWNDLDAGDILVILFPQQRVEPGHLAGFIRNGGHVLLADDYGDSVEALHRLGMIRERGTGVGASRFHEDIADAPIASPADEGHPLADGVDELVTNYPAVFTQVKGPEVVFEFSGGEAVVTAGSLGLGRFVAVSDPSVFINRMMQFPGNLQFSVNAIRFLSRPKKTDRIVLLTGDYTMYGAPSIVIDDDSLHGDLARMLNDFERWLAERNEYLLLEDGIKAIAILSSLAVALLALFALPIARKGDLDGSWTRAGAGAVTTDDFEHLVHHFDRSGPGGNYLLPATVVRDSVQAALERVLGEPEPLYSIREQDLYARLAELRGPHAASALGRIYSRLKPLPSRVQAASPWSTGFLSRRDFERLHNDAHALYRILRQEADPT